MSLLEMLIALAILSLLFAVALPSLQPWLSLSRKTETEAAILVQLDAARSTLEDLAIGVIEPGSVSRPSANRLTWRTIAPRLSQAPFQVSAAITQADSAYVLTVSAPTIALRPSELLRSAAPLRFTQAPSSHAVIVERFVDRRWTPLIVAPFGANAPLQCAFDPISRQCRA